MPILTPSLSPSLSLQPWSPQKAQDWYAKKPWLIGCNFTASTAINQIEMWEESTFDPITIGRELRWAQALGFTSVRVFLHDLVWQTDPIGLLARMEVFLSLADACGLGTMFVLFDGCWDPLPQGGRQRDPRPHTHNSGWVQGPGREILKDLERHDSLEPYVRGILRHFREDRRVDAWDIFNEPDNCSAPPYKDLEPDHKMEMASQLLRKAFTWAREAGPLQPLTSAVWRGTWSDPAGLSAIERAQIESSDVISFHHYGDACELALCLRNLQRYERPILCTEFMARPAGSTFAANLPVLKDQQVGAYCWGFVSGRTQTIYPWDSWTIAYAAEPSVWFHDILRSDGTAYDPSEVELITRLSRSSHRSPSVSGREEVER